MIAASFLPFLSDRRRLRVKQSWSAHLLRILAVEIDAGNRTFAPASLVLANHISWLDVFVLNALHPLAFVAKADVRRWPLLGWLAAKNDTVFLRRGSRGHAKVVNAEIDALLAAGKCVALFPEGTTTDGTHLLGFHAALLQPAVETSCPVQPVAIAYFDENDQPSRAPAYVGDTSLQTCLWTILSCRKLRVRVRILPVLSTAGQTRRTLAQTAHASIALSLGLHPAHNPPGTSCDPPDEPH